jgi:hypothetical protein
LRKYRNKQKCGDRNEHIILRGQEKHEYGQSQAREFRFDAMGTGNHWQCVRREGTWCHCLSKAQRIKPSNIEEGNLLKRFGLCLSLRGRNFIDKAVESS